MEGGPVPPPTCSISEAGEGIFAVTVLHVGRTGVFVSETFASLKAREDLIVYTERFILQTQTL